MENNRIHSNNGEGRMQFNIKKKRYKVCPFCMAVLPYWAINCPWCVTKLTDKELVITTEMVKNKLEEIYESFKKWGKVDLTRWAKRDPIIRKNLEYFKRQTKEFEKEK